LLFRSIFTVRTASLPALGRVGPTSVEIIFEERSIIDTPYITSIGRLCINTGTGSSEEDNNIPGILPVPVLSLSPVPAVRYYCSIERERDERGTGWEALQP
jgi:hypothetical protein